MLLNFKLENWKSFKEEIEFSMYATAERQHRERVPKVKKYPMSVLPISAIYGANASGKTNFFEAIGFAQHQIVEGVKPKALIGVEPHLLDSKFIDRPSRFCFEILIDEMIYEYSFSATRREIVKERLVKITSSSKRVLFSREFQDITLDKSIIRTAKQKSRLESASEGTAINQLFLNNTISQDLKTFEPVYRWFDQQLELISPNSKFIRFKSLMDEDGFYYKKMMEMLPQLDAGISGIGSAESTIDVTESANPVLSVLDESVQEGGPLTIVNKDTGECVIIERIEGKLLAKKLVTFHRNSVGEKVQFDLKMESAGTIRAIKLLPVFFELIRPDSKKVFLIDEINSSLHTLLIRQLIEGYLEYCSSKTRSQLLFTSHDVLLMDQDIFRRDEMWITESNFDGISIIFSLSEYKDIRSDKNIRKTYLEGRLGGIPNPLIASVLGRMDEA